jgi:hypothetical protein
LSGLLTSGASLSPISDDGWAPLRLNRTAVRPVKSHGTNVGKGKAISPEKSKELLRQLESVHGFELNPLLVTVFVATSDGTRRDIPANITELFAKFAETLLGRWNTDKGLAQQA